MEYNQVAKRFSLAVMFMDKFLFNHQYNNSKIVALAALSIALKVDDAQMSYAFCCEMVEAENEKKNQSNQKAKSKSKSKKASACQQPKSKLAEKINSKIFDDQRKEQFTLQEILQFQFQMLKKFQYRLSGKSITYWTDAITFLWDSFIKQFYLQKQIIEDYQVLLFRVKDYENFSYLLQFIELMLYNPMSNIYPKVTLVLSCLYLLVRVRLQQLKQPHTQLEDIAKTYRLNLAKSSNMIFCDQLGVNQLFGDFLQNLQMNMASIIDCIQMSGKCLHPQIMKILDYRKVDGRNTHEKLSKYIGNQQIYRHFVTNA